MYVICFYWQGDRWQQCGYKPPRGHVNLQTKHLQRVGKVDDTLPAKYIDNLYSGVRRFADREFKFVCFTNEHLKLKEEIEVRPFTMPVMDGVLPRLYMFSRGAGLFGEQVLCLDIDIIMVGSLSKLMNFNGLFCARSDFGRDNKPDGDVMSFRAGEETEKLFWTPFISNVPKAMKITTGRERFWIWEVTKGNRLINQMWDTHAPGQVVSYKKDVKPKQQIPRGASIVSCHGYPRPHQLTEPWLKQYWV